MFLLDYRALNHITIKGKFPISMNYTILNSFSDYTIDRAIIRLPCMKMTYLRLLFYVWGSYVFLVMPFGLTNAYGMFQSAMNKSFQPFLRVFVLVFFDNILAYSLTLGWTFSSLISSFFLFSERMHLFEYSKCFFAKESMEYLGHITSSRIAPEQSKIWFYVTFAST